MTHRNAWALGAVPAAPGIAAAVGHALQWGEALTAVLVWVVWVGCVTAAVWIWIGWRAR